MSDHANPEGPGWEGSGPNLNLSIGTFHRENYKLSKPHEADITFYLCPNS